MQRTLITAAVLAVAAGLTACSSSSVNTTPANTNPVQTSVAGHTSSAAPAPATSSSAAKKATVGDTVDLKGHQAGDVLAVTLVKVVDPAQGADEFTKPDAGKHFVAIQIKIVNQGKKVYSDDPQMDLKAKNAAGESMSIAFATTTAGADMPSSVDLTPGDTALGFVDFQVPDGQKISQVQYALMGLGGDSVAQWTIG